MRRRIAFLSYHHLITTPPGAIGLPGHQQKMDHFNVTIQNGELVSTRRGLRVTKQKHNGISFVNSSFQEVPASQTAASSVDFSRPMQRRFKFVNKQSGGAAAAGSWVGPSTSKFKVKDDDDVAKQTKGRQPPASKKAVARRTEDRASRSTLTPAVASPAFSVSNSWLAETIRMTKDLSHLSSSASSSAASDSTFGGAASQGMPSLYAAEPYEIAPGNIIPSLPVWTTHILPAYLSDENRKLFHAYFSLIPKKMYPFEDILSYNPSRSRDFYHMVVGDMAALHCVLMCGSVFESIARGAKDSKELAWHVSKVCSLINQKLDKDRRRVEPITLECITTLALMGVRSASFPPSIPLRGFVHADPSLQSFIGRYDHWNVHMKGLKQMIEMSGGIENLRPALLTKIRKYVAPHVEFHEPTDPQGRGMVPCRRLTGKPERTLKEPQVSAPHRTSRSSASSVQYRTCSR